MELNQIGWLEEYSLTKFLGCGNFGAVYAAEFKQNPGASAVKIILVDPEKNSSLERTEEKKRMRREFSLVNGKFHDNIVNVHQFLETTVDVNAIQRILKNVTNSSKNLPKFTQKNFEYWASADGGADVMFIRMELCRGNLTQWIQSSGGGCGSQELAQAQRKIIQGMLKGLKFLQSFKILHRDLKSENILFPLDGGLGVKIGDFGVGRVIHSASSKSSELTMLPDATPLYKARELDNPTQEYDLQADLFSLGLLIYEVLVMVKDKHRGRVFKQVRNDEPLTLGKLPHSPFPNDGDVVRKLTAKDVNVRCKTVDEVISMLT